MFENEDSTKIDLGAGFKIKVCSFVYHLDSKFIVVVGYKGKRSEYDITELKVIEIIPNKSNSF